jgi:ketosteroid isomerase-like protein
VPSRRSSTIDQLIVAFNARDLEGWMAHASEDFTMESRFSSVAGTIFRGHDGVVAWWSDLAEAWEWMEIELEGSGDVGTDRTVILSTLRRIGTEAGCGSTSPSRSVGTGAENGSKGSSTSTAKKLSLS